MPLVLPNHDSRGDSNSSSQSYRYVLASQGPEGGSFSSDDKVSRLPVNALVWVLLSKAGAQVNGARGRGELFNRARVVEDTQEELSADRRVLVRYAKGSTYRVRRRMLISVFEPQKQEVKHNDKDGDNEETIQEREESIVLVAPETPEYRRLCTVHVCHEDSFLEIGCDFGPTVERVQRVMEEIDFVPEKPGDPIPTISKLPDDRVHCIGIDKSVQSIEIAQQKYPQCLFSLEDALTQEGFQKLADLCHRKLLHSYPTVVAIDINGNREVPAVLRCLSNVLNPPKCLVQERGWQLPRLIIVKSRLLHMELAKEMTV